MSVDSIGYIYAIDAGDRVKVGCSIKPDKRVINLTRTLGLDNPKTYISKKCANHYKVEREIHSMLENKSGNGEFFSDDFDKAVSLIEGHVVEITQDQIDVFDTNQELAKKEVSKFTRDLLSTPRSKEAASVKSRAAKVLTEAAVSWSYSFGLDRTDEIMKCGSDVTMLQSALISILIDIVKMQCKEMQEELKSTEELVSLVNIVTKRYGQ